MQTKSNGILLQEIPYLGKGRILKVFTEEAGLITLMAKKSSLSPFCVAEWVYRKKQSELFTLVEGSLLDGLLDLRRSYSTLSTAGSIAQDLLRTQLPAKSAPGLYSLLFAYFKQIPLFEKPDILAASFRLKLLLHEGLLALQSECTHCSQEATALTQGESACSLHAAYPAIPFSPPEWRILLNLAFLRKFSLLQQIELSHFVTEKVAALFEERIKH